MKNQLVTIGITAFNAADSIERAVYSALNQTWKPIEIIAVDDCSTDETRKLLDQISSDHPELCVFNNRRNCGVAVSRNKILKMAKGEFVAFFDDDDISMPERIKVQLDRILEYECRFHEAPLIICHTARKLIYPSGDFRIETTMGQQEGRRVPNGVAVAERILLGKPLKNGYGACPTCSQMARLSTYRVVGGFDPEFRRSEDTEFNLRLAKMGGHFVGVAKPLVVQYMTRTTDKSLADEHRFMQMLIEKHRDVADKYGSFEFSCRWMDIKFYWLEGLKIKFIQSVIKLTRRHPWLVFQRFIMALSNIELNRNFSRFHAKKEVQ